MIPSSHHIPSYTIIIINNDHNYIYISSSYPNIICMANNPIIIFMYIYISHLPMIFVACRLWRRLPGLIFQSLASIRRRCDGLGLGKRSMPRFGEKTPRKTGEKLGKIMGETLGKPVDFFKNEKISMENMRKPWKNPERSPFHLVYSRNIGEKCGMEKPHLDPDFIGVVEHGVLFWALFVFGFKTM